MCFEGCFYQRTHLQIRNTADLGWVFDMGLGTTVVLSPSFFPKWSVSVGQLITSITYISCFGGYNPLDAFLLDLIWCSYKNAYEHASHTIVVSFQWKPLNRERWS